MRQKEDCQNSKADCDEAFDNEYPWPAVVTPMVDLGETSRK